MVGESGGGTGPKGRSNGDWADYEETPLSRPEYVSAIVHLYRGELQRATAWRLRLDTTTNWAILTTAGLLAYAFGDQHGSHWALLGGLLPVTLLLGYESRRFRIFDMWRARVRKIEENFYGPILKRDPVSPQKEWGRLVAEDLLRPRFKVSLLGALRARFTRNYWAIYTILIASWVLKVGMDSQPPHGVRQVLAVLARGPVPWWMPILYLAVFLVAFLLLLLVVPRVRTVEDEFWYTKAETQGTDVPTYDV